MLFMFYSKDYTCEGNPRIFYVSEIQVNELGIEELFILVERVNMEEDNFLKYKLPQRVWINASGFSDDEICEVEEYIRNNESLMWETSRDGFSRMN